MANTVNDVMNVIASPDYGIKNIAGTTHEILAILQGTHNSQNNIHNIVDDIRNLLQEIVNTSSKKSVEIGNNNNSTKINNKHIQNILDETKEIRKSLIRIEKSIIQQGKGTNIGVAKLSNNASEKVAKAMIKNIEKQKNGGGISAIVDAFTKLKDISLKDIILGNIKLNKISEIFKDAKNKLNIKDKDLNSIIKLINATPQMIKSLSNVSLMINIIIKNNTIKKLEDILVGKKNSIISISKLLQRNKKNIEEGEKTVKKITTLIGSLLISSILLTTAAVTGLPAIAGAKLLNKMVDIIIPITKKLSKNKKDISKSIDSAILLVSFTGLMALSSLLLASIAVTGLPAILGSVLMTGIITINIFAFKLLSKAQKSIIQGSILMAMMSASLLIFGIALGKITSATKEVTFKQVAIIATTTILLGLAVAALGIPAVSPFIILGSIAMVFMGTSLISFGIALKKISEATKTLKMKQILLVAGTMTTLAAGISAMSMLLVPVTLGSITLGLMVPTLFMFVKSLDVLSKMKTIPSKQLNQALNSMEIVGNFFKNNKLKLKEVRNAWKYRMILDPFASAVNKLEKLQGMGAIPMKLVYNTLNAISAIANFYQGQKMGFWGTIKNRASASSIVGIVKSFGKAVSILSELKKLGRIPISLVHGALNAITLITDYYNNQDMGFWGAIKNRASASSIVNIVESFSEAVTALGELKKLGRIPMSLVHGALNAITLITDYYTNQDMGFWGAIGNKSRSSFITATVKSFSEAVGAFKDTKGIKNIPTNAIDNILKSIHGIMYYYRNVKIDENIEEKSSLTEYAVNRFTNMSMNIQDKLGQIVSAKYHSVMPTILTCKDILNFFKRDSLNIFQIKKANKTISLLNRMTSTMLRMTKINPMDLSSIGYSLSDVLNGVNTIDMNQVVAVTNMFNAFNKINKSENIINKFAESVKEFTVACNNLMDAMSNNTNAINNMDIGTNESDNSVLGSIKEKLFDFIGLDSSNNDNATISNGIRITNVDEVAKAIAEKINGTLSVDVPDSQVQLLINGIGGNEWTITRY